MTYNMSWFCQVKPITIVLIWGAWVIQGLLNDSFFELNDLQCVCCNNQKQENIVKDHGKFT